MVGDRTVDSCSLVVLKNESITSVFKSNGHDLDGSDDLSDLGNIDLDTGEIMGDEGDVTGGVTRNEQMNDGDEELG
jgi:predicted aconitase with swiveling domain